MAQLIYLVLPPPQFMSWQLRTEWRTGQSAALPRAAFPSYPALLGTGKWEKAQNCSSATSWCAGIHRGLQQPGDPLDTSTSSVLPLAPAWAARANTPQTTARFWATSSALPCSLSPVPSDSSQGLQQGGNSSYIGRESMGSVVILTAPWRFSQKTWILTTPLPTFRSFQ